MHTSIPRATWLPSPLYLPLTVSMRKWRSLSASVSLFIKWGYWILTQMQRKLVNIYKVCKNYLAPNDVSVLFCLFVFSMGIKYLKFIMSTEHSARCRWFITKKNFRCKQIPKARNRSHFFKKITFEFVTIKHLLHGGYCASHREGRGTSQHFCSLRTLMEEGKLNMLIWQVMW